MKKKQCFRNELEALKYDLENGKNTSENVKKKHELEDKIEKVETVIAESSAEKYAEIIMDHFKEVSGEDGELSVTKMWSLKPIQAGL